MENNEYKIYLDFMIQCDRIIEARRPDIVFIKKRSKKVKIKDIAILDDRRVKEKETEKIDKYQMVRDEVRSLWKKDNVIVLPVVIGALGAVSQRLLEHKEFWSRDKTGDNSKNCTHRDSKIVEESSVFRDTGLRAS